MPAQRDSRGRFIAGSGGGGSGSVGTAFVKVRADVSGVGADIDRAGTGLVASLGSFGKKAAKAFAIGAAAVGAGAAIFGAQAIRSASDFAETISKSNTIFGESASAIEAWSSDAAQNFGQSQTAALDAAASFGNMFVQLGIGQEEAAGMSTAMTELASDFASFHNADISEVISAQTAAFRGEYDAVQRFVPTINAASVELKAMEMGLADSTKELTAQDKALAVQKLLMEGAGDAMGDFARTSGGLANQQRILGAAFDDIKVRIGQGLLPVMTALVSFANDKVIPTVHLLIGTFNEQGLAGVISLVGDRITEAIPAIQASLAELGQKFWQWIQDTTPKVMEQLGKWLIRVGQWLTDTAIPAMFTKLTELGDIFVDWIEPRLPHLIENLGLMLAAIVAWMALKLLPAVVVELVKLQNAFIMWTIRIIPEIVEGLDRLSARILGWIDEQAPKIGEKLSEWTGRFVGWVADAVSAVPGKLLEFGRAINNWLENDAPGLIYNSANDLGMAIINGIVAGLRAIGNKIREFIMSLVPSPGDILDAIRGNQPRPGNYREGVNPETGQPTIERRASGGPVRAGFPYWVGENGRPELFVPRVSGTIVPNHDLSGLVGSAGSGRPGNTYNVYVSEESAVARIKQEQRRQELLAS